MYLHCIFINVILVYTARSQVLNALPLLTPRAAADDNIMSYNTGGQSACSHCSPNARCLNNVCTCLPNYAGDGRTCRLTAVHHTVLHVKKVIRVPPATSCLNNPCLNGGTCIDVYDGTFKCICREGWAGQLCGCKDKDHACVAKVLILNVKTTHVTNVVHAPHIIPVTVKACMSNPCLDGKTCTDINGGYKCICPKGKRCDHQHQPQPQPQPTVKLDGKPQPLPPSDSDIIFNSFRPSAPPPRTSPSGQPEPTLNVPEPATEEEESAKQPEPTNKQPTAGNDDSNVAYGTAPAPNDSQESEMDYPANEAAVTTTEPKVQNAPEVVEEDIADAPAAVPSPAMEEKVEESPSTEQVEEAPPSSLEERVEESPAGPPTALEEKVEESPSAPPSELEEKTEESPLAPQTVLEEKVEESPSAPPSTLEEKVDELSPKPATEEKIMEVPPPSKETPSEALTDGQGAEQGPEQGPDSHDSYDSQLKPPVDDTSLLPAEGEAAPQELIDGAPVQELKPTVDDTSLLQTEGEDAAQQELIDGGPVQEPGYQPTAKYKRPAVVILMKARRPKTTPKAPVTVPGTTQGPQAPPIKVVEIETKPVPEPCNPNPCENNGVCEKVNKGDFLCKCPEGYIGSHCSVILMRKVMTQTQTQSIPVVSLLPTPSAPEATPMPSLIAPPVPVQSAVVLTPILPPHQPMSVEQVPCSGSPCMEGGTCIPLFDGNFKCVCRQGFRGRLCTCKLGPGNPCPEDHLPEDTQSTPPNKPILSMPTTVMSTPGKESPKQPNYPTPAAPEAAEEVDAPAPPPVVELTKDLAPTTVAPTTVAPTIPAECSNDSLPTDKPTNGCEPSFVYMIPKNETTLKEGEKFTEIKNGTNVTKIIVEDGKTNPCTPNPCENGGTCHAFDNGDHQYYSCICPKGFEGTHCEEPTQITAANVTILAIRPSKTEASNEGINYPTPASRLNKTTPKPPLPTEVAKNVNVTIVSENGADDLNENFEASNPCVPNPCRNGGTCHAFDNGDHHYYSCICLAGFEGTHCQDAQGKTPNVTILSIKPANDAEPEPPKVVTYPTGASSNKNNGAVWPTAPPNGCNQGPVPGGNPAMGCKPSYVVMMTPKTTPKANKQNNDFEEGANPCTPNPCQNGGTCHAFDNGDHHYYSCICPVGFEGTHCQEDICSECHIYAICPKGKCKCKYGYDGDGYDCVNATTKLGEARDFTDFTMPDTTKRPATATTTASPTTTSVPQTRAVPRPRTTKSALKKAKKCVFDMIFVLDSSGSIWRHYQQVKQFFKTFAQKYSVSENGTHVGVVTFGSRADVSMTLDEHTEQFELNEAIDKIPHIGGSTRIDLALKEVRDNMFKAENGARGDDVKKLVVLVTDGEQSGEGGESPATIAKSIRDGGIPIITIGVGDLETSRLSDIGGDINWYIASNFSTLNSKDFLDSILVEKCPINMAKKKLEKPKCNSVVDIGFVLDSSGSVWKHYDNEKKFIKSLAKAFGLSKDGSHAGVVTFSSNAELSVKLKEHNDLGEFYDAVDNIRHMGGSTRIDLALKEVKENLFTKENGARAGVKKIVILLSDGHQTGKGAKDPTKMAEQLRDDGISVIVIGIGNLDDKLVKLAGEDNFYLASNFTILTSQDFIENMTKVACNRLSKQVFKPKCETTLDVTFLLDTPGINPDEHDDVKKLMKDLMTYFGLTENKTHGSVVTTSNKDEFHIKLNEYSDLTDFNYAVDNIPRLEGGGRPDLSLKNIKKKIHATKYGVRPTVQKLVFIVTNGKQNLGTAEAVELVQSLRDEGIVVITIGYGIIDESKLGKVSGKDSTYLATESNKLTSKDFVNDIGDSTCKLVGDLTTNCAMNADVAFILDSSGSIWKNYEDEKRFIKDFATEFNVSQSGLHIGIVAFSNKAEISFKLYQHTDLEDFKEAVDEIPHMGGDTHIDLALRKASEMFTEKNGARYGVKRLAILLTDREQTSRRGANPANAARDLRSSGVSLITIGIGNMKDSALRELSVDNHDWNLLSNFSVLNSKAFLDNFTVNACRKLASSKDTSPKCNQVLDIGFVLDSSGSLRNNYANEKKFLKSLAEAFGVGKENGSQAGVVTFSSRAEHSIKLNGYKDLTTFNELVDMIRHMNGYTKIDKALRLVKSQMFKKENGGRKGVKKMVVLITDGEQTGRGNPDQVAKELRDEGVILLVIGVGKLDKKKLEKISGPDNWFLASNFTVLNSKEFVEKMTHSTCKKVQPKPPCNAIVDVGFILDSSGSLRNYYQQEKDFLKTLAEAFGIGQDGSHAGVVTFSSRAEQSIKLSDTTGLAEFGKAVDKIRHMNGYTKIDRALRKARIMFKKKNGGRAGVKKLAILITDGEQTGKGDPEKAAKDLRDDGIALLVVGVGHLDGNKLTKISGKGNWYLANNFTVLNSKEFIDNMTRATCEGAKAGPQYVAEVKPKCTTLLDIGFVMDSSGSVRKYYAKEKKFVKSLAEALGVSKNGNHAGLVTFSTRAEHSIKLTDYNNIEDFGTAVDAVRHMNGWTRIDLALQEVKNNMYSRKNGGRNKVKKLIVLITDGEQTGKGDPYKIAKELREAGITLIVIGVGKLDKSKLAKLSGKNNWYLASNFSVLESDEFVENMTKATCNAVEPVVRRPKCKAVVDIGFVLDSSGSIWKYYKDEKKFLKSLAQSFGIGEDGTHFGVVTFSGKAKHSIKLNQYNTLSGFNNAVDSIPHFGGSTRIDLALKQINEHMFTKQNGGRRGVKKLVVLVTDGAQKTNAGEDPSTVAKQLRDKGIDVLVIGVGRLDEGKLTEIAGGNENWYSVANFTVLNSKEFVENMTKVTCDKVAVGSAVAMQKKNLLDITFILDSSDKAVEYFQEEKDFLKTLAEKYGITKPGNHAGVIMFATDAKVEIKLNQYPELEAFESAVDNLNHTGGEHRVDLALREAQTKMFTPENGGRTNAKKMIVLLTCHDVSEKYIADSEDTAKLLKDMGVAVLVVGIGSVNKGLLENMFGEGNWDVAPDLTVLKNNQFVSNLTEASYDTVDALPTNPKCTAVVDIGFILDSSGSLRNDYGNEKAFLKTLAQAFGVSKDGSHAGVITFSSRAEHSIKLNDFDRLDKFNGAVDKIRHMNGYTKIDRALRLAQKSLFTKQNGGRRNVKQLIILMTDGEQTGTGNPAKVAKEMRDDGIDIIVIGIGDLDPKKLEKIAGQGNWHMAANFTVLNSKKFVEDMTKATCEKVETPDALPQVDVAVDLAFVMDSSGPNKWEYFNDEKEFVVNIAQSIGVSKDGVHLGAVTFAKQPDLNIRLNQFYTIQDFSNAVLNVGHEDGRPRYDLALREVRDKMFDRKNGGRNGVKKIIVLITWSNPADVSIISKAQTVAKSMRDEGMAIIVIGVGDLDAKRLMALSGKQNWYQTDNFKSLFSKKFIDDVTQGIFDQIDTLNPIYKEDKVVSKVQMSGRLGDDKHNKTTNKTLDKQNVTCSGGVHTTINATASDDDTPCTPQTVNLNLGTNYVFNGMALKQEDNGTLAGQCPQNNGRQAYEVEEITAQQLLDLLKNTTKGPTTIAVFPDSAMPMPPPLTTGASESASPVPPPITMPLTEPVAAAPPPPERTDWEDRAPEIVAIAGPDGEMLPPCATGPAPCSLPPTIVVDTHLTKKPIYQASNPEDYPPADSASPTVPLTPPLLVRSPLSNLPVVIRNQAPLTGEGTIIDSKIPTDSHVMPLANSSLPLTTHSERDESATLPSIPVRKFTAQVARFRKRHKSKNTKQRRKRTIMSDGEEWKVLDTLSSGVGCNMFLNDLMELGVPDDITDGLKEGDHISIFCPVDKAYKKVRSLYHGKKKRKLLMNHVAIKQDDCGSLYKTLYPGGRVLVSPAMKKGSGSKVTWKANGIDILLSLADREKNEIIILDNVLVPIKRDALDVLEKNRDVSVFYEMWRKSNMDDLFTAGDIERVCLTKDICVPITASVQKSLKQATRFKEFTIMAPTNDMFKELGTDNMVAIMQNSKSIKAFLQNYVFLGALGNVETSNTDAAISVAPKHNMLSMKMVKDMVVLIDVNDQEYKIISSFPVTEGTLHIVEKRP